MSSEHGSVKVGEYVVYPVHGVGKLVAEEMHDLGEAKVELLVISFDKDKMTLRLPRHKAHKVGLRPLTSQEAMAGVLETLTVRSKPKRAMWGRRAQEYENKINSGDPTAIAEVVRELYKRNNELDQSYSERQIYQLAIERLSRELAAVESIDEHNALKKIESHLSRQQAA